MIGTHDRRILALRNGRTGRAGLELDQDEFERLLADVLREMLTGRGELVLPRLAIRVQRLAVG